MVTKGHDAGGGFTCSEDRVDDDNAQRVADKKKVEGRPFEDSDCRTFYVEVVLRTDSPLSGTGQPPGHFDTFSDSVNISGDDEMLV